MSEFAIWTIGLSGPLFLVLFLAVAVARHCCTDSRILVELTEPWLMLAGMILAIAVAGVVLQIQ